MTTFARIVEISAFVALTMCGWLAYEYEINGYGLHPAICAIVGACLVAALVAFKRVTAKS